MRILLAALLLLAAPLAAAQSHEHGEAAGSPVAVLHDGPDNGRAVVGGFTHFGFALLEDGAPAVHRDAEISIHQNGRLIFRSASTHEYDGLFSLDVTFHEPGPYEIVVTSGELGLGIFAGEAVWPANETEARIVVDTAGPRHAPQITVSIVDADGALLPHTDIMAELRGAADGRLVSRTHLHIHDAPIVFTQALPVREAGGYVLHLTAFNAFPTGNRPDFRAVVASVALDSATTPAPALPALPPSAASPIEPRGASATADGLTLHGMYDPQRLVGLGNPIRLAGLVVDAEGAPLAHVDFAFVVTGPNGVVFESESLHEYDGVFEWTHAASVPGVYDATLTAIRGETRLSVPFQFHIAPPLLPLGPGLHTVSLETPPEVVEGRAVPLDFAIADAAGNPLAHAEVDVTIHRDGEAAAWQFKLHSHADGTMSADVAFPSAGTWLVRVDAATLMPQASVISGPAGPLAPILFAVDVLVDPLKIEPASVDAVETGASIPGANVIAALGAMLVGAAIARRIR